MNFSLIVCTYMREKSLYRLLDSINKQSLYPNEILIIDGSTNSYTEKMVKEKALKNLKYFRVDNNNRGLTKQRNFGIKRIAKNTEIVCFLDDDVLLEKNYFEELIKTYLIKQDALAVGGYITNEVKWQASNKLKDSKKFYYDGWMRNEPLKFRLRKFLNLLPETQPGIMSNFSNGRSISFLPPTGKIYPVDLIMGGVSSYKAEVFSKLSFSEYFEGYGLYEDADFSLRLSKTGNLFVNTNARITHHHDKLGRPNQFNYGKMVIRNGWYVWRVKFPKPSLLNRFKWNFVQLLQTLIRFTNIITTDKKKVAFTDGFGRVIGWFSLLVNKPKMKM